MSFKLLTFCRVTKNIKIFIPWEIQICWQLLLILKQYTEFHSIYFFFRVHYLHIFFCVETHCFNSLFQVCLCYMSILSCSKFHENCNSDIFHKNWNSDILISYSYWSFQITFKLDHQWGFGKDAQIILCPARDSPIQGRKITKALGDHGSNQSLNSVRHCRIPCKCK